ncbi:MAG: hypothetical protein J2P22_18305, partial [Nocardioides sp.]|nr:hypothetical protein [Nocardioides sp.]
STTPTRSGRVIATVLPGHREIAGVATTGVRWEVPQHGRNVTVVTRWYAEDVAGNVWWFGQDVRRRALLVDELATRSFIAGENGAEAGLVLAAKSRVGDGYFNAHAPGIVERRSTVLSVNARVTTPNGTYVGVVLTRDASNLQPTEVAESSFARGVGLAAMETTGTTTSDLSLTRVRRP